MARPSKVNMMPPDVRAWLEQALKDRNFTGYEELETLLRDKGIDISRGSIHRFGQKLERTLSAIKASTEAAKMLAASVPDDEGHLSAAALSMVQSQFFDLLLSMREAEDAADPEARLTALAKAAKAISDVTRASTGQKKWENEVRAKLVALEVQAQSGKGKRTLDLATLQAVKEMLYGG